MLKKYNQRTNKQMKTKEALLVIILSVFLQRKPHCHFTSSSKTHLWLSQEVTGFAVIVRGVSSAERTLSCKPRGWLERGLPGPLPFVVKGRCRISNPICALPTCLLFPDMLPVVQILLHYFHGDQASMQTGEAGCSLWKSHRLGSEGWSDTEHDYTLEYLRLLRCLCEDSFALPET